MLYSHKRKICKFQKNRNRVLIVHHAESHPYLFTVNYYAFVISNGKLTPLSTIYGSCKENFILLWSYLNRIEISSNAYPKFAGKRVNKTGR